MNMSITASRTKSTGENVSVSGDSFPQQKIYYEGEVLDRLLTSIKREIATARNSGIPLPEKLWLKQQFSVGVNEVTRVLERMPPIPAIERSSLSLKMLHSTRLQVILIASDCHPRLLTKHLESLANSKKVPVVFVKDRKRGSLRLGELVKLKTAIAIGVKDKGNQFNQFISTDILHKFE